MKTDRIRNKELHKKNTMKRNKKNAVPTYWRISGKQEPKPKTCSRTR